MKKFLSIFKVICFLMILVEVFFLGILVFPGFSALISPNSYINMSPEDYEWFKLFIITLLMFLLLIFLIILIYKSKITTKTNDKNIIYMCILIIIYYLFIVREQILYIINIIPLIPIGLTFIYIVLKNILFKNKDIEK